MNIQCRHVVLIASLVASAGLPGQGRAEVLVYTSGHADIGLGYADGDLELHWHFSDEAVVGGQTIGGGEKEFGPDEIAARVPSHRERTRPAGSQWDFTGTTAGGKLWVLPIAEDPSAPFLGWATDELTPSDWQSITWSMTDWSIPTGGAFSLWDLDEFGGPQARFSTANPASTMADNTFPAILGSHQHFAWGFTAEGVYDIELTAFGTHTVDGFKSDTATFRFLVGDFTAVPEPSSLTLLGVGLTCMVGGLRSRRNRRAAPVVDEV